MLFKAIMTAIFVAPMFFVFWRFMLSFRCIQCRRFFFLEILDSQRLAFSDIFFPKKRTCFACDHLTRSPP